MLSMLPRLQLDLLGAPEVTIDHQPVSFETNKSQALLFYLALNPGWHARDLLAELLWPDMTTSKARKNLRDGLTQLRAVIGPWLLTDTQRIEFNFTAPQQLDIQQFQQALTQGQAGLDLPLVEAAVKLYRGDFLLGFHVRHAQPFEEWVLQKREELHNQLIGGLEWLAHQHFSERAYTESLAANRHLLKLEPWRESAHQLQMQLLALLGRHNDALAQYKICQRILADELDVQPASATVALYEQIRAGKLLPPDEVITIPPADHQPASELPSSTHPSHTKQPNEAQPSLRPSLHNLPRQMTPLIGRELEINLLSNKLLDPHYPLITVGGVGGVGKTRLAVAIAEKVQPAFPDGVWFVPLADITSDADLTNRLVASIGKVLQLNFAGPEPLLDQLLLQLHHKQLLFILDNFEHLLHSATLILHLLQAAHGIKILLTSRRRLNFQAEYFFQLDGLTFPDEDEASEATGPEATQQLLTYPGITLFIERATRIHQQFSLTAENQADVRAIVQLVSGIPLGIELAAALLRYLTTEQTASKLRHSYTVLSTTLPDLPQRHRSMQAVLTYSWQLLSAGEAHALARCAVFRGGFTEAAAHAVTGASMAILTSLTDQSLLHQTTDGRFEMHELIRQFAAEQLRASPTAATQIQQLHSAYYAEFLAQLEQSQNRDYTAQVAIRVELDNIRAAWQWAVDHNAITELGRALKSLARFYYLAGYLNEAVRMLTAAIAAVRNLFATQDKPAADLQRLLVRLLEEVAFFEAMVGHPTVAEELIQESIHLAQELADPALEALAYLRLGDMAWNATDYQTHRAAYTRSLALTRLSGQRSLEAHCLSNLGMNYDQYAEYSQAIPCYEAALAIARELGNRQQESIVYNNLGVSHERLGNLGQALHYHQSALQFSRELSDQEGLGFAYLNLGELWSKIGETARSHLSLTQALTIFRTMQLARLEAKTLTAFADLYEQQGDYTLALDYCKSALLLAQAGNYQSVEAKAQTVLGYIFSGQANFAASARAFQTAHDLWQHIGASSVGQINGQLLNQATGQLLTQSGLAQIYLQQDNKQGAQAIVNEMLSTLDNALLNATKHPGYIFLIGYQILAANRDSRAYDILQWGCQFIENQASTLGDPTLQRSFLQTIPAHRELMAALQQYVVEVA